MQAVQADAAGTASKVAEQNQPPTLQNIRDEAQAESAAGPAGEQGPAPLALAPGEGVAGPAPGEDATRSRLLRESPGEITEEDFKSLKSPDDDAFISQYTKQEIVDKPGEFRDRGLDPPKMWVRNTRTVGSNQEAKEAEEELRRELGDTVVDNMTRPTAAAAKKAARLEHTALLVDQQSPSGNPDAEAAATAAALAAEEARMKSLVAEGAEAAAANSKETEGNRGKLGAEAAAALAREEAAAAAALPGRPQDAEQLAHDLAIAALEQGEAAATPTEFDDIFKPVQDTANSIVSNPLRAIANRIIAGAKKVLASTPTDLKPGVKGTMTKALNAAKEQLDAFEKSTQTLPTRLEMAAALRRSKERSDPLPESEASSPLPGAPADEDEISRRNSLASLSSVAVDLLRNTDFTAEEQTELSNVPPANTDIGKLYSIYATFEKLSDTIRAENEDIVGHAMRGGRRKRRRHKTPRRRKTRKTRNSTFRRSRKH